MASVSVSVDMAASGEAVWSRLGDFNGLAGWLEFIRSSRLSDDRRLRQLETIDGAVIVEELSEHSDVGKFYRYSIVEGPDPVTDYMATLSARRTGTGNTTVTWASHFEPVHTEMTASLVGRYEILYRTGLESLKTLVEAQGSGR
jgi:hypothetical protein